MSSQFLERSLDSDRILRNAESNGGENDFLAKRPLVENESRAVEGERDGGIRQGLLSGVDQEDLGVPAPQAPAGPRNWDSLTSRGFLGWRWLFNVGGARDKRNAERAERRNAFKDAWNRGGSADFVDSSGILGSKYARGKLSDKKEALTNQLRALAIVPNQRPAYEQNLAKYNQLNGLATQARAAGKAKSGKKGKQAPATAPAPTLDDPSQLPAGMSDDEFWHAAVGSQPFGPMTGGPGPSALRKAPAKSGMKPASPLLPHASQSWLYPHADEDREARAKVESTQAEEIRAHEAFLEAKRADTTGELADLDGTLQGSHSGRVRVTGRQPSRSVEGEGGEGQPAESESRRGGASDIPSALVPYARAMRQAQKAEKNRETWAALRHWHEQGDLSMPKEIHRDGRGTAAAFFNGYWNQEKANPSPTRSAGHGRHVRFDSGDARNEEAMNRPASLLDPAREGGADRVLPTGVHRYLTTDGEEPEVSDGDAIAQSILQTRYNRHMASLAPGTSEDDLIAQAERYDGPMSLNFVRGTQEILSNRRNKTSSESSTTPGTAARAMKGGAGYHKMKFGMPHALLAQEPERAQVVEEREGSENSFDSLDQLASQIEDET